MPLELEEKLGEKKVFLNDEEKETLNKIDTIVVITGAPIVNTAKAAKLRIFFLRMLKDMGPIVDNDIFIPINPETGESSGVVFVEFVNPSSVPMVISKFNNYRMDKAHTLHVYSYRDIDDLSSNGMNYEEPQESSYEPLVNINKRPEDLWSWLNDENGGEQFAIRYGNETEVYKTGFTRPILVYGGEREKQESKNWCNSKIEWSPQGTYLVTYHAQGVVLWGGEEYGKLLRYEHPGVQNILFSPKERFLITWNGKTGSENMDAILIWDVRSGKLLRKMPCGDTEWPSYKFSFDERYFATKGKDSLAVYEFNATSSSTFTQLDHKLISAIGIRKFEWSPLKNQIIYWSEERQNKPASVYVLEIPSKQIIQSSSAADVDSMEFKWQNEGKYLAVYMKRRSKNKKRVINQFSIFRMTEKLIPVEKFTIDQQEVFDYAFEGCGSKFAVVSSDIPNKSTVLFYDLEGNKNKQEVTFLYSLPDKQCNHIYWCPTGKILLMAGLGSPFSGSLEWFNVEKKELIAIDEQYSCNGIAWDYSGRYVSAYVVSDTTNAKYTLDNGYTLYNAIGTKLIRVPKGNFVSFQWRPYPTIQLTDEQKTALSKSMKSYTSRYNMLSKRLEQLTHINETRSKLKLIDDFRARRARLQPLLEEIHEKRKALGIKEDSEDDFIYNNQIVEIVLDVKEEVIG